MVVHAYPTADDLPRHPHIQPAIAAGISLGLFMPVATHLPKLAEARGVRAIQIALADRAHAQDLKAQQATGSDKRDPDIAVLPYLSMTQTGHAHVD